MRCGDGGKRSRRLRQPFISGPPMYTLLMHSPLSHLENVHSPSPHSNPNTARDFWEPPLGFRKPSAGVTTRILYTQCTLVGFIITCVHVNLNYLRMLDFSIGNLNTDHPSHLEMKWRYTTRIWEPFFGSYHSDLAYTVHFVFVSNYRQCTCM